MSRSELLTLVANPGLNPVGAGTGWWMGHVIGLAFLACERRAPTSPLLSVEVVGLVATAVPRIHPLNLAPLLLPRLLLRRNLQDLRLRHLFGHIFPWNTPGTGGSSCA